MSRSGGKKALVLLVDDHDLVRAGLKAMLSGESSFEVVGEGASGREAVEQAKALRPDLILMDVRMPDIDGIEATRRVKERFPGISVVMLTMYESQDYMLEAVRAGAAGYVLKDAPAEELRDTMERVLDGEPSLDQRLSARLLQRLAVETPQDSTQHSRPSRTPLEQLTPREVEVLRLMSLGYTNREIGNRLYIGMGTVKNHVQHIIAKLGASDRTHSVVLGIDMGLIELPQG